jgi:hypothetical protein
VPDFFKRPTLLSAWVAVAVWVLAYGLIKVINPDGLNIDSAEQVYFAQSWQMGYGTRQPPLYTWLLLLLKPAQVPWVLALEFGRYLCLLIWLGGVQALARACGANRSVQAKVLLAHLGLLLAMWRVHDSLTHTVLAAGITIWASVAAARALSRPAWWPLVGLLAALACLSKLNAALWCVSSLVSAWIVILQSSRGVQTADDGAGQVSARAHLMWMALALLVFCLTIAPYAHWWLTQPSGSVALARRVVVSDAHLPMWKPVLRVLLGALEYLLLAPLLLALLAWRVQSPEGKGRTLRAEVGRWLGWQTVCGLSILIVILVAMRASHFTPRWLWPVIPGATVWMCVKAWQILDGDERLAVWRAHAVSLTWALVAVSIGVSALRWWVPGINAQRCKSCWTDRPAEQVSATLHQHYGSQPLRIVTGDDHLAGILAQVNERDSTWTSNSVDLPPPADFVRGRGPCVAAWITVNQVQAMPDGLRGLVGDVAAGQPVAQTPLPMSRAPQRTMWLLSMPLPESVCDKAQQ